MSHRNYFQHIYMGFNDNYLEYVAKHTHGFSAYVQREGNKENCVGNFLPSVSKMHLN